MLNNAGLMPHSPLERLNLNKALDNGISKDELIELITHLAFYSGCPTASSALTIARRVFEDRKV